jgi:ABC-type spermidine/putrescine transport system permease subunit I
MAEKSTIGAPSTASLPPSNRSPLKPAFLALPIIYYGVFFVPPLIFLAILGFWIVENYQIVPNFSVMNYADIFSQFFTKSKFGLSLAQSLYVAATTTIFAVLFCYILAMGIVFCVPTRYQRLVLVLAILPFWSSYILRLFSWQAILAQRGILNNVLARLGLDDPLIITNTQIGTRIGLIHYLTPILIIILFVALINVDRKMIEAARDLGATRWQAFVRVILPLSKLGLIFAAGFAMIVSFGDVLAGLLVGGGIGKSWLGPLPLYPDVIMTDYNSYTNLPRTAALATILVLVMVIILVVSYRFADKARQELR